MSYWRGVQSISTSVIYRYKNVSGESTSQTFRDGTYDEQYQQYSQWSQYSELKWEYNFSEIDWYWVSVAKGAQHVFLKGVIWSLRI